MIFNGKHTLWRILTDIINIISMVSCSNEDIILVSTCDYIACIISLAVDTSSVVYNSNRSDNDLNAYYLTVDSSSSIKSHTYLRMFILVCLSWSLLPNISMCLLIKVTIATE